MARKPDKSKPYDSIGTGVPGADSRSDSLPAMAPGIGTRISAAADQLESRKYAAGVMGVSSDTLQRYIREDVQPSFEPVALLCLATGVSMRWIATAEGPESEAGGASQTLSEEALTIALEYADRAIGVGWLPRPKYARLVRLLYDGVSQGLPTAQIEQFATAAARSMAQGGNADGGKSGVGAAGQGRTGGDPAGAGEGGESGN